MEKGTIGVDHESYSQGVVELYHEGAQEKETLLLFQGGRVGQEEGEEKEYLVEARALPDSPEPWG